jgi:hypothetical protein
VFVSFFTPNSTGLYNRFGFASPGSITAGAFFGRAPGEMRVMAKASTSLSFYVLPPLEPCSRIYLSTDPSLRFRLGVGNLTDISNTRTCLWHFHPEPKRVVSSVRSFSPADSLALYLNGSTQIDFRSGNISSNNEWANFFVYRSTDPVPNRAVNISIFPLKRIPFPVIRAHFADGAEATAIPLARGLPHYREELQQAAAEKNKFMFFGQLGLVAIAMLIGYGCRRMARRQRKEIEKEAIKTLKARLGAADQFELSIESEDEDLTGVAKFHAV